MIYFILVCSCILLVSIDSKVYHHMSFSYIMAKSMIVGLIAFMSLMSGVYIDFGVALSLSIGAMSVNFFVCLLVHLHIFVLYKLRKLTIASVWLSFGAGYFIVFIAVQYLNNL